MEPTKQDFINNYLSLTTGTTATIKEEANRNILMILNHPTIWNIGKELLKDDNQTYQFLGAQSLYQKTSGQFRKMSIDQRQQLKQFIFSTEFNQKIQSYPVVNKLASICGFIASEMIRSQWQRVIKDLAEVMNKNYRSFIKGLSILQQIPQQCKNMEKRSFKEKMEIQQLFLKSEAILIDIFVTGLKNIEESRDLQRLVDCIKSWSKFGIKILQNQALTDQLLIHFKGHKMSGIQEILTSTLKLQFHSLKVQQIQSFGTKSMLSQQSIKSLKLLLQNLLKNQKQSTSYSYLLSSIITYFPWILAQSNQVTKLLFQIMINFIKSSSLDLKYSSILFWITIIQQATQKASIIKLFILRDILSPYYQQLFSTLIQQLKIISVNLLNHMDEQEQPLTDDQQQNNFHVVNVSSEELKYQCSNLIEQLYIEMSKTINKNIILQSVTSFLSTQQFIQLGIFILRSITAVLQPSQILSSIITHIMNLRNGNVSVKIEALRLIMTLDKSMINETDVLKYVSQYFNNQKLSQHAIHTFYTLSTKMRNCSISQQFCQNLYRILSQDVLIMKNTIDIQKVLSISFRIISQIRQISTLQPLLTNIFRNSAISLQSLINSTPYSKTTIINNMILISSVVSQLKNIKQISFDLFVKYSKEYCNTVIQLLTNLITQLAPEKDVQYGPNNQLFYIIEIHQKCLDVIGKQLSVSINLLTMSCQLINKSIHNCELLTILSSTILALSVINPHNPQEVTNQDILNSWLESHLKPLDSFLIISITTNYDPDLIRVYFYFQKALLQHNSTLINKNSLQLAYHCCTTIVQSDMLREVMEYIEVYLYYCKDENVAIKLLNCVFKRFQVAPRVVCKLLINVLQSKQEEDIRQSMNEIIRTKYPDIDEPQIQLLIRVFALYILHKDINSLSQVLFDLEISHIELTKIKEKYEYDRKLNKKK